MESDKQERLQEVNQVIKENLLQAMNEMASAAIDLLDKSGTSVEHYISVIHVYEEHEVKVLNVLNNRLDATISLIKEHISRAQSINF